ncbi:hypothetical protein [Acetobacter conturbans]|uniref:Uncharacterized protein n=1 Tax=Acetobacter conturbans TaxID=1737472 RepID=A0ABX0JXS8_9PROT|nr:hypothetical protein [Acetobacter conturbans]NHN88154.1 hypothetical protein [Acetobacter conturbans]
MSAGKQDVSAAQVPSGDDRIDLLNAAQLGAAYKGPVYYKGQPVPAAQPVRLENTPSVAPKDDGTHRPSLTSPTLRAAPASAYHGSLYYPANSTSLPAPRPN